MLPLQLAQAGLSMPSGDPYSSNVGFLCHFDGADGSTTFTDSSINALSLTAVGNAQIDTAQSKAGGASGLFDGSGDRVEAAASAAVKIVGDFTIEGWVRFAAVQGQFFTIHNAGSNVINLNTVGGIWIGASGSGLTGSIVVTTGVWYHIALTRSGNFTRLFVDGVQDAITGGGSLGPAHSADPTLHMGGTSASTHLNGWLDEWRVTVGVARYTANFTPPTPPFTI